MKTGEVNPQNRPYCAEVYSHGNLVRTIDECRILVDTPKLTEVIEPDGCRIILNGFSVMFFELEAKKKEVPADVA